MALTIYEGIKDDQQVDENIDEEILRLLGLEDISDLDYDEYKTLLKERMAAGRMPNNNVPSEDTERLTEEFKRVKKETGRFKVKNNKIKFDSVVGKATEKTKTTSSPTKALVGSKVESEKEVEVGSEPQDMMGFLTAVVAPSLTKIETSLFNILSNLSSQQQAEDKAAEKGRTSSEKSKKRAKESNVESGSGLLGKAGDVAKKVTAPLSGIFGSILKFFTSILAGVAALKLLEFFKDPGKFFRDMVNGVIDFFNGVIESVFNIVLIPFNNLINALNEGLTSFAENINKALDGIDFLGVIPEVEVPTFDLLEAPQIPKIEPPPEKETEPEPAKVQGMAGGGKVESNTGTKINSMGADTQMVALQPGEVVMSKKAVQAYGSDTLLGMNAAAGGTNKPKMGEVPGYQGGGMVGVSGDAQYDVIIPLDHVKPENIRNVPDTPGGNTFRNARATGAAGRERDAQDPAARMIAERMAAQGLRVKTYSPEEAGDYQTYDKFLKQQAKMGVRIMPLHFDAGVDPNSGKVVGTGFLTRTRAGDREDSQFAAPIQKVLADFQKANPDLGRISQDTVGNATVNVGAASPTALVELGIMTFWEKKYGKDFVNTPEFKAFANNIADAAVQGSGIKSSTPASTPKTPIVPTSNSQASYKGILDLISSVEAPSYDTINGGHIDGLSNMTIAEARQAAMNAGYGSGAMGRYQQMPQFVLDRAKAAGLDPNKDLFNAANQDLLAKKLIDQAGYKKWKSGEMTKEKFAYNLAGTWRGLPQDSSNLTFQDQYASGNKAHTTWSNVMGVLGGDQSTSSPSTTTTTEKPSTPPAVRVPFEFKRIPERQGTPNQSMGPQGPSTDDLKIPSMDRSPLPVVSPVITKSDTGGVSVPPPPSSRTGSGSIVPVAIPGQQTPSSSSGPGQSKVPMFSPIDLNNPDLLVVKSIYSIVG